MWMYPSQPPREFPGPRGGLSRRIERLSEALAYGSGYSWKVDWGRWLVSVLLTAEIREERLHPAIDRSLLWFGSRDKTVAIRNIRRKRIRWRR